MEEYKRKSREDRKEVPYDYKNSKASKSNVKNTLRETTLGTTVFKIRRDQIIVHHVMEPKIIQDKLGTRYCRSSTSPTNLTNKLLDP